MTRRLTPFAASVLIHGIMLSMAGMLLPRLGLLPGMDITPVEFIRMQEERPAPEPLPPARQEPRVKEAEAPRPKAVAEKPATPEAARPVEPIAQKKDLPLPQAVAEETAVALPVSGTVVATDAPPALIASEAEPPFHSNTAAEQALAQEAPAGPDASDMDMFKASVRGLIERSKFYPSGARKRGYEGVVGVRFRVAADGSVMDVRVVRPCRSEMLNRAACEAVEKAGPFRDRPPSLGPRDMDMEVDLAYRLK